MANPIGIAQMFQATHQGRFEFSSGKNFNRDFPELAKYVDTRFELEQTIGGYRVLKRKPPAVGAPGTDSKSTLAPAAIS